ncbi:MAG: CaiB/BaiF CoA transferase family protein, partial [Acetobacteraceae bacterium]
MRAAPLHRKDYTPNAPSPLKGIRVVDLSRLVAGNMVTHVLADFGADVIKVEDPARGDDLRHWQVSNVATFWKVYARNKRSFALDYRNAEGRALLLRLLPTADVLVENFIPGKLERLGLAPEILFAANPRLVVARISGWGQSGPNRHKPGFGSLVEALSGFAAMNGYADRPPVLPPLALADMITGLYGAFAIMIALRHVEVGVGRGQVIDLSLFESMLSVL